MGDAIIEIKEVTKKYPGITALDNVTFDIQKNMVHCIVGENGAGKSTLIKILTGAEKRTSGKILYNSKDYNPANTKQANDLGIAALFQELNVVDQLTVEENLTLGVEKSKFGIIQKNTHAKKMEEILHSLDPGIFMSQRVFDLSVAKKQIIQMTKAICMNADVLVMDEPTASLSEEEIKRLFKIIATLRQKNITVIYISHKLNEIFEIGDTVTVLLDGKVVTTTPLKNIPSQTELVKLMLGKIVAKEYCPNPVDKSKKVMEVAGYTNHVLKNVSFELYAGEVLGFYGLIGSGKTELARAIFGCDKHEGEFFLHSKQLTIKSEREAIANGIALVPEERRTQGLITSASIKENVTLMNPSKICAMGIVNKQKEKKIAIGYIRDLSIAARSEEQIAGSLSGGNQQKVVFGKCLNSESDILMLDEPTRGVDVGAKEEIYNIIRQLAHQGKSIIVFSSELPEVLNICDRIVLLYDGSVKAIIDNGEELDHDYIMHKVAGGC